MSFEQLISTASLGDGSKPKYQSIAEDLAQAILNGQVPMGEKLPPQRNLAHRLGVTTGTISRAYAILERQGLATARVGDGTYVRSAEHVPERGESDHQQPIDLAHNVAMVGDESSALHEAFQSLATDPELMRQVLSYQSETGMRRHREAGAQWLRRFGTSGQWNRVMVTHGAQHGLACVLRTVARPGDAVLTESLSYPGLQALARRGQRRLGQTQTARHGCRGGLCHQRVSGPLQLGTRGLNGVAPLRGRLEHRAQRLAPAQQQIVALPDLRFEWRDRAGHRVAQGHQTVVGAHAPEHQDHDSRQQGDLGGAHAGVLNAPAAARAGSSANLALPQHHPLQRGQPFHADRAARVQLVGADADLGAQPVLEAIGKARAGVDHHAR